MQLVIATRNTHKLDEIRAVLAVPGLEIIGTDAWPDVPDPEENGATFEENAAIKARAWASATGLPALADDSGITVTALGGAPGIHSARYAGTHGDSAKNNALLLHNLAGQRDRRAAFVCALALALPDGSLKTLQRACTGTLLTEASGAGGFGYDPLFVPDGFSESFAVLPATVKNTISHRAKALEAARSWFA